jgi:hypothetical protein
MKKIKHENFLSRVQVLSAEEATAIIGGESLWYWIGYGIGYVTHVITSASGSQTSGQQAMNAALG